MTHDYYVYMITNKTNKILYTGVTNDLSRRLVEHQTKIIKGFTAKYNVDKLIWFEVTEDITAAIAREKQIKGWLRSKKNALIEEFNPNWDDLAGAEQDPSLRSG